MTLPYTRISDKVHYPVYYYYNIENQSFVANVIKNNKANILFYLCLMLH